MTRRRRLMCGLIALAIAVSASVAVLLIGEPVRAHHIDQQREAATMIRLTLGGDRRVASVNLGDALELVDEGLSLDRMHLTAAGNARLADQLVTPVLDMASRRANSESAQR